MTIEQIKQSIDKKGVYFCLKEAWKRIWPIWWVRRLYITNQIFEERSYHYLKKKYLPMLNQIQLTQEESNSEEPGKKIWVCWLQGEENAPQLVRRCLQSIRQYAGEKEVCVITNDNISSYIEIPSTIKRKLQQKKMQYATYSDYIRIALLDKYGGIWIDATVLLTDKIPEEISKEPLFCFQKSVLSQSPLILSSWFLVSNAHNQIIRQTKYLFEQYWEHENHLCNYYLFHLLFSIVVDYNESNRELFRKMPYVNNIDVHVLQSNLFEPFQQEKFNLMCKNSFAHKLTYKFQDPSRLLLPNTFYSNIMHL